MHLYSNSLSAIAMIFSSNMSDLIPACFPCGNSFTLSRSSSGLDDKNFVFENDFFL